MSVPFLELSSVDSQLGENVDEAITRALAADYYVGRSEVENFEAKK